LFLLTFTACEKDIPAEDDALTRAAQQNDLNGRRAEQPTKGIYIKNGKKYLVK